MGSRGRVRSWLVVLLITAVASGLLGLIGMPSPVLFGALLGGLGYALTAPERLEIPRPGIALAQALLGVTIGATMEAGALRAMASAAVPITLVTAATILVSLAAGWLLARRRDVSAVTGVFAMIAGGASGIVAIAHDLGADDRVVTVVQYLRVLVVLLVMPLVTTLVFRPETGLGTLSVGTTGWLRDLVFTASAIAIGLGLARLFRFSTATLLAPMLVAAVIAIGGWFGPVAVPGLVEQVAFAIIGVQVGLRFTRASIVSIARMLPLVLVLILGVICLSAGIGTLLAALTPVDPLTAYLATTPGGLFAVLVVAADSGSDVTYVMAVQLVRLLVILLLAPLLARWLRAHTAPQD